MRECCKRYVDMLGLVDRLVAGELLSPEEMTELREFVQQEYDKHIDDAGEASLT